MLIKAINIIVLLSPKIEQYVNFGVIQDNDIYQ